MTVADFLTRLDGVRDSGHGWMARCPGHPDRSPSLSVAEGEDGRILLTCFAGCRVEAIAAAVGLTVTDLFSEKAIFPPTRGMGRSGIASPRGAGAADFSIMTPADLRARVRQEIRRDYREDLAVEQEIATTIFMLHQRARGIRRAVTALARDDERALDLLAAAAADERTALLSEAILDELRAEYQAVAFNGRRS